MLGKLQNLKLKAWILQGGHKFGNNETTTENIFCRLNALLPVMHDMRGWHILNGTLKTYWSIYDKVNNLLWCCVSYEKCQDSTCQHSSLTLGLWFCTFLWCVRWISHFGNRRTCFHWKCNVLRRHHWYIFKWDHEFKPNLPNLSLDLHPMSMEITEAGRRLRFPFHSWNQKTDRQIGPLFLGFTAA